MNTTDLHQPWFLKICEDFDDFCKRVDDLKSMKYIITDMDLRLRMMEENFIIEKIDKEQQQLKACKKRTELENKLAVELKLKSELTRQLSELTHRGGELERVCAVFESRLTIADSDQNRLENAKESYQLAKELTGIRLDFSAPPNVAKGYIKNESCRALVPFEMTDGDALWRLATNTHLAGKENVAPS